MYGSKHHCLNFYEINFPHLKTAKGQTPKLYNPILKIVCPNSQEMRTVRGLLKFGENFLKKSFSKTTVNNIILGND